MALRKFKHQVGDWLRTLNFQDRLIHYARSQSIWNRWEGSLEWLITPPGQRILVLAPHMDDEVIGCGGTIRKCVLEGKEVAVVYLTDGRRGNKELVSYRGQGKEGRERALIQIRKDEARRACTILGIKESYFLDARDGKLRSTPGIRKGLLTLLSSFQPDVVFYPFFLENHVDHRETARILLETTAETDFSFDCYAYEAWTPLYPNCAVDIMEVIEAKRQALSTYESQIKDRDYLRAALGLNSYRSILGDGRGYVEVFWRSSLKTLRTLYGKVNGR